MEHKFFSNQFKLFGYLDNLVEGLDLNRTLRLPKLWFSDVEGNDYKCQGSTEFCTKFNSIFNTNFIADKSYVSGKKIVLFFGEEKLKECLEFVEQEDVQDVTGDEQKEEGEAQETSEEAPVLAPDWVWIDTLENTPEDKLKLDKCGEDFGIKLNRRKTLSNMIKSFKEQLETA